MHMRMRTFTRLTSFTFFHVTWPELSMSERKRQVASDKKQGVISMLQELLKMNKGGDSEY